MIRVSYRGGWHIFLINFHFFLCPKMDMRSGLKITGHFLTSFPMSGHFPTKSLCQGVRPDNTYLEHCVASYFKPSLGDIQLSTLQVRQGLSFGPPLPPTTSYLQRQASVLNHKYTIRLIQALVLIQQKPLPSPILSPSTVNSYPAFPSTNVSCNTHIFCLSSCAFR